MVVSRIRFNRSVETFFFSLNNEDIGSFLFISGLREANSDISLNVVLVVERLEGLRQCGLALAGDGQLADLPQKQQDALLGVLEFEVLAGDQLVLAGRSGQPALNLVLNDLNFFGLLLRLAELFGIFFAVHWGSGWRLVHGHDFA